MFKSFGRVLCLAFLVLGIVMLVGCSSNDNDTAPTVNNAETTVDNSTTTPETPPVEEAPPVVSETTPIEEAPVEEAPVEEAPAEETPAEEEPAEEAPAEEAPAEEAPAEEAPAEEAPASAYPITLGLYQFSTSDANQFVGWGTDGIDDVTDKGARAIGVTAAQFTGAKKLVVEFENEADGEFTFVYHGEENGWSWTQTDGYEADGNTVTVDLTTITRRSRFTEMSTDMKIYLGYFSNSWDDLVMTNAYLTD